MAKEKTEKKAKKKEKPDRIKAEELDEKIVKLAKQGTPPTKIGLALKEKEGVPKAKLLGKDMKISKILDSKGVKFQDDLTDIKKKIGKIEEHLKSNKQDKVAKRSLITTLAKSRKLDKYKKKRQKRGKNAERH